MTTLQKIKSSHWFSNLVLLIWIISIAFVSYLSLKPGVEFPIDFWSADLIYHALAYAWLSVLPFFVFEREKSAQTGVVLMIILGIGLEFCQTLVPGRVLSVTDLMANSFGSVLGLISGKYLKSHLEAG